MITIIMIREASTWYHDDWWWQASLLFWWWPDKLHYRVEGYKVRSSILTRLYKYRNTDIYKYINIRKIKNIRKTKVCRRILTHLSKGSHTPGTLVRKQPEWWLWWLCDTWSLGGPSGPPLLALTSSFARLGGANKDDDLKTWGPVTMAASNMISSNGLMSLLATRHRPFPALHFTLIWFVFYFLLENKRYLGLGVEKNDTKWHCPFPALRFTLWPVFQNFQLECWICTWVFVMSFRKLPNLYLRVSHWKTWMGSSSSVAGAPASGLKKSSLFSIWWENYIE